MCLSWSRGKVWQLGFGQFPVVLSINFFLWFRDEYFYLQLLLIALTYLTKEFVTWERGGRRTHIFNPSAISLALLSILLLSTDSVGLTNGIELTMSFSLPPSFFEVIFLLGLVTQFLFRTTLVTFGSAAALCILYSLSQVFLGTTFNPTPIDIVVFLGLTFLVTDPSTSPKTETGKFLFGMTYGTGILITFIFLQYHRQPAHFDKILVVPIVNLLVKFFDSCAHRLVNSRLMKWIPEIRYSSAVTLGLYICFFVAIAGSLKQSVSDFAGPLPEPNIPFSPQMVQRRAQHMACRQAYPKSYRPFGFGSEFVNFRRIRKFVPQTDLENDSLGEALRRLGEWDGADMYFRQALAINPSYAPAHLHMGISLIEQNKVSEAITHIRQSLEIDPRNALAHVSLGTALGVQGRHESAVDHLRQALEIDSSHFMAQLNLGSTLLNQGKVDHAIDWLRRALEIRPFSGPANMNLSVALEKQGQLEDAIGHMRRALVVMPDDREGHRYLTSLVEASNQQNQLGSGTGYSSP